MALVRDRKTIVLDEEVADRLGLSPGERLQVEAAGDKVIILRSSREVSQEKVKQLLEKLRKGIPLGVSMDDFSRERIYSERS